MMVQKEQNMTSCADIKVSVLAGVGNQSICLTVNIQSASPSSDSNPMTWRSDAVEDSSLTVTSEPFLLIVVFTIHISESKVTKEYRDLKWRRSE